MIGPTDRPSGWCVRALNALQADNCKETHHKYVLVGKNLCNLVVGQPCKFYIVKKQTNYFNNFKFFHGGLFSYSPL